METLYFHIGLSKTGTTFLQKEVFPLISSIRYLGKPNSDIVEGENPWTGVLKSFFECSPVIWRDFGEKLFTEIFGGRGEHVINEKDVLISDENACSYSDPFMVREHMKALHNLSKEWGFKRVRVIGSVRQQAARMASSYAQYSDRLPGASQRDFEAGVHQKIDANYYREGVTLDYELLRQALVTVVGSKNVMLSPFELMKEDLRKFLGWWFEFLERPVEGEKIIGQIVSNSDAKKKNVRSSSEKSWSLRGRTSRNATTIRLRPGRLFAAMGLPTEIPLRWPDLERGDKIRLTSQLEQEIMSTYEASNRAFARAIDMDLSQYNYY